MQKVQDTYGMPVVSIASLTDIMTLLQNDETLAQHRDAVSAYRARYGCA